MSDTTTPRPEAALLKRLEETVPMLENYRVHDLNDPGWLSDVEQLLRDAAAALVAAAEREQKADDLRQRITADALKRIEAVESQLAALTADRAALREALTDAVVRWEALSKVPISGQSVTLIACANEMREILAHEQEKFALSASPSTDAPEPLPRVVPARPGPVPGHVAHEAVGIRIPEETPTGTTLDEMRAAASRWQFKAEMGEAAMTALIDAGRVVIAALNGRVHSTPALKALSALESAITNAVPPPSQAQTSGEEKGKP